MTNKRPTFLFISSLLILVVGLLTTGVSGNQTPINTNLQAGLPTTQGKDKQVKQVQLDLTIYQKNKQNQKQTIYSAKQGDTYFVDLSSNQDGYLSLWQVTTAGTINQLYPNPSNPKGEVKADKTFLVDPDGITEKGTQGFNNFLLVWTKQADRQPKPPEASDPLGMKQLLGQLNELEQNKDARWHTYRVNLAITDNPEKLIQPVPPLDTTNTKSTGRFQLTGHSGRVFILSMGANVRPLRQTHNDANRFANAMAQLFNVPHQQVRIYSRANAQNFRGGMQWLKQAMSGHDTAIIYFSGHGKRVPDQNGDEPDGSDEAFVMVGSQSLQQAREHEIIRDDEFLWMINQLPSRHVLTFVDSCFASGLQKGVGDPFGRIVKYHHDEDDVINQSSEQLTTPDSQSKNILVAAAGENQQAMEDPRHGGLFTNLVIHALYDPANINMRLGDIISKALRGISAAYPGIRRLNHTPMLERIYLKG